MLISNNICRCSQGQIFEYFPEKDTIVWKITKVLSILRKQVVRFFSLVTYISIKYINRIYAILRMFVVLLTITTSGSSSSRSALYANCATSRLQKQNMCFTSASNLRVKLAVASFVYRHNYNFLMGSATNH